MNITKPRRKTVMKPHRSAILCVLLLTLFLGSAAQAGDIKFPVGPTIIIGFNKVAQLYEDNSGGEMSFLIPIGASFHPYYQFDFGLRIGMGIGPLAVILGDVNFYNVPVNMHVGYSFIPKANMSPYIKTGIMINLGGGDYVTGRTLGLYAALGMELMRRRMIGFGFEVAYSSAAVEFEESIWDWDLGVGTTGSKLIKPNEVMISFFVIF
jgi:hypothetical protein